MTTTDKIDQLLKERDVPKLQFYKDCAITPSAFSLWRQGKTNPTQKNLTRIAAYLQVPVAEILGDEFHQIPQPEPTPEPEHRKTCEEIVAEIRAIKDIDVLTELLTAIVSQQSAITQNKKVPESGTGEE